MKYYSKDVKKSTLSHIILIYVISAAIMAIAIYLKNIYAAIVCVFLILSNLFQKEKYISDEGIVDDYSILWIKHKYIWGFDEIDEIDYEWNESKNEVQLHIMRGIMIKRFIINANEFYQAKDLILSHNKDLPFNMTIRGKK